MAKLFDQTKIHKIYRKLAFKFKMAKGNAWILNNINIKLDYFSFGNFQSYRCKFIIVMIIEDFTPPCSSASFY